MPQADEGPSIVFQFESENQIELILNDPPQRGWNIRPHKKPVQVSIIYDYVKVKNLFMI